MKKRLVSILAAAVIFLCSGCSVEDITSGISDAAQKIGKLSGFGGETVEIITEEIISVEPAAIPTSTEQSLYCYNVLTKQQKKIYRVILAAVREMTEGFFKLGSFSGDINRDISAAYQAVSNDHPELFWMPYTYLINGGNSDNSPVSLALSYSDSRHNCSYLIDSSERDRMVWELDLAVGILVDQAAGLSRFEAECIFHDALCSQTTYEAGEPESLVYTAYGALVNGKAVCEGYSRAMQLLCQKLGIPCTLISGESRGEGHLWNLINPGDGWYHLDVTWDDNDAGDPYYLYFNVTDDEIKRDHTISPDFSAYNSSEKSDNRSYNLRNDSCTSTAYNYFTYNGLNLDISDYSSQAALKISEAAYRGEKSLTFRITSDKLLKSFEKDYNSCVQAIQKSLNSFSSAVTISEITTVLDTVTFHWR